MPGSVSEKRAGGVESAVVIARRRRAEDAREEARGSPHSRFWGAKHTHFQRRPCGPSAGFRAQTSMCLLCTTQLPRTLETWSGMRGETMWQGRRSMGRGPKTKKHGLKNPGWPWAGIFFLFAPTFARGHPNLTTGTPSAQITAVLGASRGIAGLLASPRK